MLSVTGIDAFYGPSQVLFGFSIEVGAGEVVTLMGRNGMGKTTAVKSIRRGERPWTLARIWELFPRLADRRRNLGSQLSGGEQQMLAIGRALMTNPRLLILDEATEGLAPLIRAEIWRCLGGLKGEGQSILVIDKNLQALIALATRHVIIEKGRVVWSGDSARLAADPSVSARYLGV